MKYSFHIMQLKTCLNHFSCRYGTAQTQPLPQKGFRWATESERKWLEAVYKSGRWEKADFSKYFKPNMGFFARVDLKYPKDLHDLHQV